MIPQGIFDFEPSTPLLGYHFLGVGGGQGGGGLKVCALWDLNPGLQMAEG